MNIFRKMIYNIIKRPLSCIHEFRGRDIQYRNEQGTVKWPCDKCGKMFEAECGLDILHHGKCIGDWSD